jgi:UDP-glucose 4-epimerase
MRASDVRRLVFSSTCDVFNLGNGHGFSVRQVLETVERVTGRPVASRTAPRRPGDPPTLVGSAAKARRVLGWTPRFAALEAIIDTAWSWYRSRAGVTR